MSEKIELDSVHIVPDIANGAVVLASVIEDGDGNPKVDQTVDRTNEFFIGLVRAIKPGYSRVLSLPDGKDGEPVHYQISVAKFDNVEYKDQKVKVAR